MKELLKKQLNKYIETGKDSKLEIFAASCNGSLKLTKAKKALLLELVDEYKQDNDVFEDILAFCGFKQESKQNGFNTLQDITNHVDTINKEKYAKGLKYDILDQVCDIHLGDVKDEQSIAYKVCHGKLFQFDFPATAYKPDVVIKRLLRKNFVENKYDWYSFWDDQAQKWVCTTNPSYELRTKKHLDSKSGG